ncbi:GDSL esterase/lipase-like protein [Cinnamomum micranthum f. kanehirae]|uniref:GDSL esterase/lipase-like protein n=1 Tax=Cinnamomum micranthum f. kanehirae TaxID=337451 RepID=A0A3S3QXC6_9MAGN|nr:GDSL esterase/lipase-like protein [Cinnamomum micranthum f. kanehirae]
MTGFQVTNEGCCGIGRNKGQVTCLPLSIPSSGMPSIQHKLSLPSLLRGLFLAPPSYCYLINIQQMALKLLSPFVMCDIDDYHLMAAAMEVADPCASDSFPWIR